MLVILATSNDSEARELAARWPDTALLTPRDLSRRGWRHELGPPANRATATAGGCAVISGKIVPVESISAVYIRLPNVMEYELATIRGEDRPYVAAEMNAFLLSWLSSLSCRVVNRPSPLGLAGPSLRPEAWTQLAARADIPVRPVVRNSTGYQTAETSQPDAVTVVGARCFGDADPLARERAQALARAADVELFTVAFDHGSPDVPFIGAEPSIDIFMTGVEEALLTLLYAPQPKERQVSP